MKQKYIQFTVIEEKGKKKLIPLIDSEMDKIDIGDRLSLTLPNQEENILRKIITEVMILNSISKIQSISFIDSRRLHGTSVIINILNLADIEQTAGFFINDGFIPSSYSENKLKQIIIKTLEQSSWNKVDWRSVSFESSREDLQESKMPYIDRYGNAKTQVTLHTKTSTKPETKKPKKTKK